MITLASVIEAGRHALADNYGKHLTPHHWSALNAMALCQSGELGSVHWSCTACTHHAATPKSCGHRSCPRCQQGATEQWLSRQQAKLLPAKYFMVTFTVPRSLRAIFYRHQASAYNALFAAAISTLRSFAQTRFNGDTGACAVLHTHSRRLDYHPHLHVVVPAGALTTANQWKTLRGKYLYRQQSLAKVFKARLLAALREADEDITLPDTPAQWVVDCRYVGKGLPALQYLSRYLYRGVISEQNIIALNPSEQTVTFRYKDSQTQTTKTRTLSIADFLWRIMLHLLPKGLRRVRDYGLLHGNAKKRRVLLQLLLRVTLPTVTPKKASFSCSHCQQHMQFAGIAWPVRQTKGGAT